MKYFTIKEMCSSSTAQAKGIDNTPTAETISNLTELINNVLDPLREMYGKPIRVSSGYRSEQLNRNVNGSKSSQHRLGMAADITTGDVIENRKLFQLIQLNLPFDKLIDEKNFSWVHVSYNPKGNRKQILKL